MALPAYIGAVGYAVLLALAIYEGERALAAFAVTMVAVMLFLAAQ